MVNRFNNIETTESEAKEMQEGWNYPGEHDLAVDDIKGDDAVDHMEYISKSRLKKLAKCKRKFGYVYLSEVRPPENFYMRRGSAVHDTFEKYYQNLNAFCIANRTVPDSLTEMLPAAADWFQFLEWVAPFFDWELNRLEEARQRTKTEVEAINMWLPHSMENDLWIDDSPIGKLPWRGPYDLLVESCTVPEIESDNGYTVVDYKTGSTPDRKYRDEGIHIDLEFYAWMLEEEGFNMTGGLGFYPKGEEHVVREMPNRDVRKDITEMLFDIHNAKISTKDFPINESPLCSWCEFQEQCPTSQNKSKDEFS